MHSSEPIAAAPLATGPELLSQLGRLIVRARSPTSERLQTKLRTAKPSTSQVQPRPERETTTVEVQLTNRVQALWAEHIPVCIEVLLAPDCQECFATMSRVEGEATYDKQHIQQRGLLLERWTMHALVNKNHDTPAFITSQWLLNAVRSQLHFSQLSAWLARLNKQDEAQRRRKLSRESCNFKKIESNCDDSEQSNDDRKLNIVYAIKIPGESYKMAEFTKPPTDHTFPVTDIGNNAYLKVVLESLPRIDDVPKVRCTCQKRRVSKDIAANIHDELIEKLNDLTLTPKYDNNTRNRRLSIVNTDDNSPYFETKDANIVDDRMHTNCSEKGKHKCSCDEESDGIKIQAKKLDDKRIKEIAKYKRRLRKENKLKKLCDSTSSEGDVKKEYTSIPILQASRFDRFRAIGCYRNQTYLTLPASKIECKSPFTDSIIIPTAEVKKSVSVSTQTEDLSCECGLKIDMICDGCNKGMTRSEANYNIASLEHKNKEEIGVRRKCEEEEKINKKLKCDLSNNLKCDKNIYLNNIVDDSINDIKNDLIRRPRFRRVYAINDKIDKMMSDRRETDQTYLNGETSQLQNENETKKQEKIETKRQKTFSINDDYVTFENCDYGTIDHCEIESPKDEESPFKFIDTKMADNDNNGSNTNEDTSINDGQKSIHKQELKEMGGFRYSFDSAASMVFHSKTGLPLTSSPAPLRRGNNCFDFDDSINGISGIKSALFCENSLPTPLPRPPPTRKLKIGPPSGLLGSFEECLLQGRLPGARVSGYSAELGASGALCPPHRRLPVTAHFHEPAGHHAPYSGHINLGPGGYRVSRSGTIQVSLFNPHGTLVKMFVVLYDLTCMPPMTKTFLRQRTFYMPAGLKEPERHQVHKWLRYLIHLRFMTSKSGKLYLHTDIRILVLRKSDLDTATAHSALYRPMTSNDSPPTTNQNDASTSQANRSEDDNDLCKNDNNSTNRAPNRVFGGCSDFDESKMRDIGYENQNGVAYELRSFTYAPDNPKYSPR